MSDRPTATHVLCDHCRTVYRIPVHRCAARWPDGLTVTVNAATPNEARPDAG